MGRPRIPAPTVASLQRAGKHPISPLPGSARQPVPPVSTSLVSIKLRWQLETDESSMMAHVTSFRPWSPRQKQSRCFVASQLPSPLWADTVEKHTK